MLILIYSSGLRVSEIINLKAQDIIRDKMLLKVRDSKGNKDRYTILSEIALQSLVKYWKTYRPKTWLFPGVHGNNQMSVRAVQYGNQTG
jgi:integrase/recombinase XerD